MVRTSAKGATRGEAPPSTSASAAANAWRNSASVSPPTKAARNRPSGLSARRICTSAPGRSLTNCSASPVTTRSREASRNGNRSSSATSTDVRVSACAAPARGVAAMIRPTAPATRMERRTASVGVPRSTTTSKVRRTAESRSAMSSATRSRRNVTGPSARARRRRCASSARSNNACTCGVGDIGCRLIAPRAAASKQG